MHILSRLRLKSKILWLSVVCALNTSVFEFYQVFVMMAEGLHGTLHHILENTNLPKVLKVTSGNLHIPNWKTFKNGDCFVVFSCEKQVIVMDCMKSHVSLHMKQNLGFIPWDTSELFYDIHCLGKTYDASETLVKEFPRYFVPTSDLFAITENDGECESIRVKKRTLLEVEEIREYKDDFCKSGDSYMNAQDLHGEMLCCRIKDGPKSGLRIILPHALRCEMEIIQDTEKYSLLDISERFNLPRKLQFCNHNIDQHIEATKILNHEILASSVSNKMVLLADVGKCNLVCVDENIQECSNVICELLENLNSSSVQVEVLENVMEEVEMFAPFYAFPVVSAFGDVQTYIVKGTEKKINKQSVQEKTPIHRTARPDIDDQYIELWKPDSQNRHSSDSQKSHQSDNKPSPTHSPRASSPSVLPTHLPRAPSPSIHLTQSPSVSSSVVQATPPPRVSSPTSHIMTHPPRVPSPTLPPRFKEKANTMPVATIKVSDPVPASRSKSLPTDSLDAEHPTDSDESSMEKLGVEELCLLFREYKLDKLAEVCKEEKLDGKFIVYLTDDDMKEEPFFLGNFQIKKLNKLKSGWRAT